MNFESMISWSMLVAPYLINNTTRNFLLIYLILTDSFVQNEVKLLEVTTTNVNSF